MIDALNSILGVAEMVRMQKLGNLLLRKNPLKVNNLQYY